MKSYWKEILEEPLKGRYHKPRDTGVTMIFDKGMGLAETKDLLNLAVDYIDFIKLGFGTSALYSERILESKIEIARSENVHIYPGGTFLEIALMQDKLKDYLQLCRKLGFSAIEVSDGTINLKEDNREDAIKRAVDEGFIVLSEVGKKHPEDKVEVKKFCNQISKDLEDGAHKVIVEGRESGKGVGIYNDKGEVKGDELTVLESNIEDIGDILWEAPLKQQQKELILRFGPNVNIGNVPPAETLALEALRVGLRGDTLRSCYLS